MKAMVLRQLASLPACSSPLELADLPQPAPGDTEVLLKVSACGVCHTELDEIEGRTAPPRLPVVPGHQVIGRIESMGRHVSGLTVGERVGVAWIHWACGHCRFCLAGNENLCGEFKATGRDVNGGYAEYMVVPAAFTHPIPGVFTDVEAAPLLCAGAIGYRSIQLARLEDGQNLGLTGFGASAHLVLKMVRHRYPNAKIFVFARSVEERSFALELGACWSGETDAEPPEKLTSIIDTTPAWTPIVEALKNLEPGGRLVVNAIRKEALDQDALLRLDYPTHLWMEKEIKSVANVTRSDVRAFLELAGGIPIHPEIETYELEEANRALLDLKTRRIRGAKVLRVG
jgi:propanol-preferring alcohol dehydrogenase